MQVWTAEWAKEGQPLPEWTVLITTQLVTYPVSPLKLLLCCCMQLWSSYSGGDHFRRKCTRLKCEMEN